ncbi:MAG TPA: translocation/assembly module TamB [Longimicrobiales bacterium]
MGRQARVAGYVLLGLAIGLLLAVVLFLVLTRTQPGVERVGRLVLRRFEDQVQGELRVRRITSEGLLGGAKLHDVSIADPQGRPFLRADSIQLGYDIIDLVGGRFVFDRVSIYGPEVVIERLPGDTLWNYEELFADTTPDDGPDRLIRFDDVRIHDGVFVIRTPWEPDPGEPVEPDDTARLILRRVPGGTVRELRFEDVDAALAQVLWESPVEEGKFFDVTSLSTRGYIWEDPFDLRDLRSEVTIRDSVIAFDVERFRLPATYGSALGRVNTGEERTTIDIRVEGDQVAFGDLQWLYPPLPDEGGGNLVFRIQSQPTGTLWLAQDAHLRAPGTEVAGTFGIVTGDTLYFTQVSLRASPLNLELLEEVLPVDLPVEGLMVGTVEVEGPLSSLSTRGALRLVRAGAPRASSAIRWSGTVDLRPPYGVQAFEADVARLELDLVTALHPEFQGRGTLSGRVRATGRLDRGVRFTATVNHRAAEGPMSTFEGGGTFSRTGKRTALDAELMARSVTLDALAAAFPVLERFRGEAYGPITVRGTPADLVVNADLTTSGGRVELTGRADLTRPEPRYAAEGRFIASRLDELIDGLPETAVDARFRLEGEGVALDSMRAGIRIDVDSARIGGAALTGGVIGLELEDGIARVDTLSLDFPGGRLAARGGLGITAGQRDTLELRLDADSLDVWRTVLFPDAPDIAVEPGSRARLAGAGHVEARLQGSTGDLAADGIARLQDLMVSAVTARHAGLRFAASHIGTDTARFHLAAAADTFAVYGRRLASATLETDFGTAGGRLTVDVHATEPEPSDYRLAGEFRPDSTGLELRLHEASADTHRGRWALIEPSWIHIGRHGIQVDEMLISRADGAGRVRVAGRIPWRSEPRGLTEPPLPAAFRIDIQRLPLFAFRDSTDMAARAQAMLTGRIQVTGTALAPRFSAELAFSELSFADTHLDRLDVRLDYADRLLEAQLEARYAGRPILEGGGSIPLDLRLTPVARRRLAEPLGFEVRAQAFPVAILATLTDGFRDVGGALDGVVTVAGTTVDPVLGGRLTLTDGAATWSASGVRYRDITGTLSVRDEQVVEVALSARSREDGRAELTGTLTFLPLNDPRFDLTLRTSEFVAANRQDVEMVGTGELRLGGRYSRPVITGRLRVDRGVLHLDEVWRMHQIVALDDPLLVDTAVFAVEPVLPAAANPFLRNLVVDSVQLTVGRDTWLRGRNLDVELAGEVQIDYDRRTGDLQLTGTLNAIRGYYDLAAAEGIQVRRFTVSGGTVEFAGIPGINPILNITAVYRVRLASGPLDIEAVVTGTLQNPAVALRSDAEPPISESDLLSYVLFGQAAYALGGAENRQLNRTLDALGRGEALLATSIVGYAAAGLQSFIADLGVFDYFAITEWQGASAADIGAVDLRSAFARQQVEVGRYLLGDNLFVSMNKRLSTRGGVDDDWGMHLEWRLRPTWTAELFFENRFARFPSFGLDPTLAGGTIRGFFLFREWGY